MVLLLVVLLVDVMRAIFIANDNTLAIQTWRIDRRLHIEEAQGDILSRKVHLRIAFGRGRLQTQG